MTGRPRPDQFWAKLKYAADDRSTGDVVAWHPLVAHSADVAAVLELLLSETILGRRLARLAGWDRLHDVHVARLCVLALLHDAGKANHSFQDQWCSRKRSQGHVGPMVNLLASEHVQEYLMPLGVFEMLDWFAGQPRSEAKQDLVAAYLLATWGHHGAPVPVETAPNMDIWTPAEEGENEGGRDPKDALQSLGTAAKEWFPEAFDPVEPVQPLPKRPKLQHAFNGVLTLADWIASDETFFDYAGEDAAAWRDAPWSQAQDCAQEAVRDLFLDADRVRNVVSTPIGFDAILSDESWDPHPVQEAVRNARPVDASRSGDGSDGEQPGSEASGSLIVLESDTGSGKTEAALARFARLFQAREVDGLYFAVPTRSAATQLHGRIERTARRMFPEEAWPPVVLAVPGYIRVDDTEAVRLPGFEVRWEDDEFARRGWAAEHSKRYLAGAIAVGTVDQVLLSALRARHAHMRSSALLRHLLVVDEVHASDVYMTRALDRVLELHLEAGGHALLMSATLGAAARVHFTTGSSFALPSADESEAVPYPLVTSVSGRRTDPDPVHAQSSGREKDVVPEPAPIAADPEAVAARAVEAAAAGARVLVIRNRVVDCIETQKAVESAAVGVPNEGTGPGGLLFGVGSDGDFVAAPHHSRYAPQDRQRLDEAIETAFGKNTTRKGVVAVATQTVEQSLDIDADLLITDLCPIDVLLQRIGRLHRHDRCGTRPGGFETARCVILTPAARDLTSFIGREGKGWDGEHGLGTVYRDLRMIEAAWRVVEDASLRPWQIPHDNRRLVERGTHPEVLQEIVECGGERWDDHEQYVLGEQYAHRHLGTLATIDRSRPFGEESFVSEESVRTRLGEDDYTVQLPEPVVGPFGKPIREVTLAAWQVSGTPETDEAASVTQTEDGFRFFFAGKDVRYDRFGVDVF